MGDNKAKLRLLVAATATSAHDPVRQKLNGVVPLLYQGDAHLFMNGESVTWTVIANPFGYTAARRFCRWSYSTLRGTSGVKVWFQ